MKLNADEVVPGVCVLVDADVATKNGAKCSRPANAVKGVHPFVCVAIDGDQSVWAPLSSKDPQGKRVEIPVSQKAGHEDQWIGESSYLIHGNQTWRGPTQAFVEASARCASPIGTRNHVNAGGLAAVVAEIAKQGGWTTAK